MDEDTAERVAYLLASESPTEVMERASALLRDAWYEGWYDATNGKWGLPEPGSCPYGDMPDE